MAAGKSSVDSDKGGRRATKKCNEEETDSEESPDGESDEEKREPAAKRSRGKLDCIQKHLSSQHTVIVREQHTRKFITN